MFSFRLRFWCLLQIAYEREMHRHDSALLLENAERWRQMRTRTVIQGHIDPDFFGVLDMHDDALREPDRLTDERILDAARKRVEEYMRVGLGESGHFAGYLDEVREHLRHCAQCRRAVCDEVRKEMLGMEPIRKMAKGLRTDGEFSKAARDRILRGLQREIANRRQN